MTNLLVDEAVLEPDYLPAELVNRDAETRTIDTVIGETVDGAPQNLYVSGARGTGKTHLVQHVLDNADETVQSCYVSCIQSTTQYQVLQQLYSDLTDDSVNSGHHVSDLQRMLEDAISEVPVVIVLDEIDFLLHENGENLLYYLSRISGGTSLILISASQKDLREQLDNRVHSSLQPKTVEFDQYSHEQRYRILQQRAEAALEPQSLRREALTYIASHTENLNVGRIWLKTAAETATDTVTEETVKSVRSKVHRRYVDELLSEFSDQHHLLYQALLELTEEQEPPFQTGTIYERYKNLCQSYGENPLSNRQISDFLKHLELLDLINAEYHYGGRKGKTREIQLNEPLH